MAELAFPNERTQRRALLSHYLSIGAFLGALLTIGAATGYLVRDMQLPPHAQIKMAARTFKALDRSLFRTTVAGLQGFSAVPVSEIATRRLQIIGPTPSTRKYLFTGGPQQYLEYCPEHGCLAAVFDRSGQFVHGYPFRPDEFRARRIVDLQHDQLFPESDADTELLGLVPLQNGDLVVTLHFNEAFPQGGGTARIDKDGHVIWYRRDFAHHWPTIDEDQNILVPTTRVSTVPVDFWEQKNQRTPGRNFTIGCPEGYARDAIEIINQNGQSLAEISVFDALLDSPFSYYLLQATEDSGQQNLCDPLHVNYVRTVGSELASQFSDVASDDLLVSVRAASGVLILDRHSHQITHFFSGSYLHQHSAQPFGKRILLFDNEGADRRAVPSRVVLYDPGTREETTIFPTLETRPQTRTFTSFAGNINVAPDHKTALVAVTEAGIAYEIEIQTGRVLTVMENLHDLRTQPNFPHDETQYAARFSQFGVYYLDDMGANAK